MNSVFHNPILVQMHIAQHIADLPEVPKHCTFEHPETVEICSLTGGLFIETCLNEDPEQPVTYFYPAGTFTRLKIVPLTSSDITAEIEAEHLSESLEEQAEREQAQLDEDTEN